MFQSKKNTSAQKQLETHINTPVSVQERAEKRFAEVWGGAMVNSNRLFLICVLLALAVVVLVLTIAMMMPLKEVRPYIVEVNSTSGTVSKPIEVQKITPQLVVLQNCTNANASQP